MVKMKKMVKKQKAKIAKSLCNGDFRFVGILAFGRVLRWDLLVVKAHGVYLRRAYFQEHRPKRGGVVPICFFQLISCVSIVWVSSCSVAGGAVGGVQGGRSVPWRER